MFNSNIIKKERGGKKGPIKEEEPVIDFAFASVVSIANISNKASPILFL